VKKDNNFCKHISIQTSRVEYATYWVLVPYLICKD